MYPSFQLVESLDFIQFMYKIQTLKINSNHKKHNYIFLAKIMRMLK